MMPLHFRNAFFRPTLLAVPFILAVAVVLGADAPDPWRVYPEKLPDSANALRFNIDACVAACLQHKDPGTKQEWDAARDSLELELRRAIGLEPWPEKTPLVAQITGRTERDTYTIENLAFQSVPQFYVTANVYIPKDAPRPLPAVVVTAGHAMDDGKNYDVYRTAQHDLLRQGFLVLAYDPVGQGERKLPGNSHPVSYAAMLVGQTNLRYMLWDSIRALDYLLTRPDVDPNRIAIAGNSGGGLNAMYAMPLEPRFAAGTAFCCPCSFEAWIRHGGNHCICNHLPGICQKMEQFQFVGLCAPRPYLVGNGERDPIFPIQGARDTIRRAGSIYGFFEAAERLKLVEAPLGHGWSQPLREAGCGWLNRWLQHRGDGSPVPETEIKLEDKKSPELKVFKDGRMPEDAKSYVDLIRQETERLVEAYPAVPGDKEAQAAWAAALRQRLWEILGGQPQQFSPSAQSLGEFVWEGRTAERLSIRTEPNLEVPAILIHPHATSQPAAAAILLHDGGKTAWRDAPITGQLLEQGIAVLALDVRGLGEGKVHDNQCASDAIVLGRPLLAQQAWDVICAARVLAARDDVDDQRVAVYGKGSVGLIAIMAAALSDSIKAVAVEGSIGSFRDAIADPLPLPLCAYAPNLLKAADLPQLLALCAPRPLLWLNAVDAAGNKLPADRAEQVFQPVLASYRATGAETAARVVVSEEAAEEVRRFLGR